MKIYAVTEEDFHDLVKFFPKESVQILPQDYSKISADLIVFMGGVDIQPSLYQNSTKLGLVDKARDEWELKVLRDIRKKILPTKKTLGICRGLQLLNVGFGGNLVIDIAQKFGKSHSKIHQISWSISNAFSDICSEANSVHHQCINRIGRGLPSVVLGVEPETNTIEAILWGDSFLGIQFHPEYYPECQEKTRISDMILDWVSDKIQIIPQEVSQHTHTNSVRSVFQALSFDWSSKISESNDEDTEKEED